MIDERTLPIELKTTLKKFKKAYKDYLNDEQNSEKSTMLEFMTYELQGSINSSLYGFEIDDKTAKYLRKKYLID